MIESGFDEKKNCLGILPVRFKEYLKLKTSVFDTDPDWVDL
jgi:hypothetical protein